MTHLLSLAHLTLIELTPPEMIEAASAAGFRSVNLRLAPVAPGEHQHPMIGATLTPMMRETLARMCDLNVAVHDVEIVRLLPDTDIDAHEPLLAAAAELGARHMLVAGDSPDEAAIADRYARLFELGALHGIGMGLEFMPWTGIKNMASARRVLTLAGTGSIIVDSMHVDRSGGSAEEIAALPANQLAYFQLCDAPRERPTTDAELIFQARQARLPPGDGGIDLRSMVRALPPDTVISVEIPMHGLPNLAPPVERARALRRASEALIAEAAAAGPLAGRRANVTSY
ncbi:TIM barrel protein [Caballeronia sp. LP006]|jgi:sugar phosphate isomerase/epimerase|uniref:sugar phosphate isomerase/epimerase family protein n=1 Tax=Caballeronia sp. LP006 TaxID=3038552 RepID=UPI00285E57D8|nr:TIM barrel protein [Caballeronia sp. LP006]MDR5826550.1 TIM barrel protein [Caballeronia sp. LP006]